MKISIFSLATFLLAASPSTYYCKANGDAEQSRQERCAIQCPGTRTVPESTQAIKDMVSTDDPGISCLNVTGIKDLQWVFDKTQFNRDLSCWDVSAVTNMKGMFARSSFNGDINGWDVGNVENMEMMFYDTATFNRPIGDWNVGNVKNMDRMFGKASSFDEDIGQWDVGAVTSMVLMLYDAKNFNGDIGQWDVGNVRNMTAMFHAARSFNQDIGAWNVRKVRDMYHMFSKASSFDQDIGQWDVGSVTSMYGMFEAETPFNQPLDRWDISKVTDLSLMFSGATEFNQCLGSWPSKDQNVFSNQNMFLDSGCEDKSDGLHYCRKQDETCPLHLSKWELTNHRWGGNDIHITSLNPTSGLTGFILYEYNKGNSEDVQVQIVPMPDNDNDSCYSGTGTPNETGSGEILKNDSIWGVSNGEKEVYHATKPTDVSSEEHKLYPHVFTKDNAAVGKATFEINDLFESSEDGLKETGKLCIRASYMCGSCFEAASTENKCCNSCKDVEDAYQKEGVDIANIDDNIRDQCKIPHYVSYLDYKLTVDVWRADSGEFSTSTNVKISGTNVVVEEERTEEVEVVASLCDGPTNTGPFKLGQDFSICLSVSSGDALGGEYYITGFKNVVCKNDSSTRELVDESGTVVFSSLTTLNKDADNEDAYKGFTSVVTTGYVSEGGTENSFTCEGGVELTLKSSRRDLQDSEGNAEGRDLQASEEKTEGVFALEIAIATENNGVDEMGYTATGVAAGPRALATGAMAVAAALF